MQALLNKIITDVVMEPTGSRVMFVTGNEAVVYYIHGPGNPTSGFYPLEGVQNILETPILSTDALPERAGLYEWVLHTSKGSCKIVVRNPDKKYSHPIYGIIYHDWAPASTFSFAQCP